MLFRKSSPKNNELAPPPEALTEDDGVEVLRAWISRKRLHCSIRTVGNKDREPIFWGVLISDVARHAADALHKQHGWSKQETLNQIQEVFNRELKFPTAETSGDFLD